MITPTFKGTITKGKLNLKNTEAFDMWCGSLEGKEVDCIVRERKKDRTIAQNSFYWLYLTLIEKETGNDANDVHEVAKRMFLRPRFVMVMGKEVKLPNSTTNLSSQEFSEYLDKICAWCGVPIPIIEY